MDTEDLRLFCLVADAKGFSAASRTSGIEKSVISKAVRRLEGQLGARLFERSTRQVRITEAGTALLTRGRHLLELTERVREEVRGSRGELDGELRIGAPLDLGAVISRGLIPAFLTKYPGIKVSLALSYDIADLLAEGIDVALRAGPLSSSTLVSLRLAESGASLWASDAYLARHGTPRHPRDLASHSLLGFRDSHREEMSWSFARGSEELEAPVHGRVAVENFRAILELCTAGVGIARLGDLFFEREARARGLKKILTAWKLPPVEIHAVYPSRDFKPRKLEAFLDFVRSYGLAPRG
jgi:DNA-binding transcriptional LysR family regulator